MDATFFIHQHPVITLCMMFAALGFIVVVAIHKRSRFRHVGGDDILLDEHEERLS